MIVVDASAVVEMLLQTDAGDRAFAAMREHSERRSPASMDAEAYVGVRRAYLHRRIGRRGVAEALAELRVLPIERVPLPPLVEAAAFYIDRLGGHDVFYVLLALQHRSPLLTYDRALHRAATAMDIDTIYIDRTPSH